MSPLFGKGGQSDREREQRRRSADEREQARRDREARRAAREGRDPVELPPLPPDLEPRRPAPAAEPPLASEPQPDPEPAPAPEAEPEPPVSAVPVPPTVPSVPARPFVRPSDIAPAAPDEHPADRSTSSPPSDADLEHPEPDALESEAPIFVWPDEDESPAPAPLSDSYHEPALAQPAVPDRSEPAPTGRVSKRAARRVRRDDPAPVDPELADLDARSDSPVGVKRVAASAMASAAGASPPPRFGAPPRGVPRRRRGRRAVPIVFLLLVAAVAFFMYRLYQPGAGEGTGTVAVTIPQGNSAEQIGDLLAEKNVVPSSFFFSLRARLDGGNLRSGTVELKQDMSYAAALDELTKPAVAAPKLTKITLPEGPSSKELAGRVKAAGFTGSYTAAAKRSKRLDPQDFGAPKQATLEGFLFPATYELKPGSSAKALVSEQVKTFKTQFAKLDLKRARARKLSKYDVLIIASMIEREAGVAKDRRLISGVIYNRLKQGIPLGIDATIRYDLENFSRPLRVSELEKDTPYNTRTRTGLPPGPIGNPGLASLQAAANPASNDFIYYVVKPCANGAHAFSSTDAQFQQDVAKYNKKRDELGGKDPSQC